MSGLNIQLKNSFGSKNKSINKECAECKYGKIRRTFIDLTHILCLYIIHIKICLVVKVFINCSDLYVFPF